MDKRQHRYQKDLTIKKIYGMIYDWVAHRLRARDYNYRRGKAVVVDT